MPNWHLKLEIANCDIKYLEKSEAVAICDHLRKLNSSPVLP